jgi:hypothetical protein
MLTFIEALVHINTCSRINAYKVNYSINTRLGKAGISIFLKIVGGNTLHERP